jgi:hypothetical protein
MVMQRSVEDWPSNWRSWSEAPQALDLGMSVLRY